MHNKYHVSRTQKPTRLNGDWDGDFWVDVAPINVKQIVCVNLNGKPCDNPAHKPNTQAKMLYDDKFIYVIFRVEDRYVRAVTENHQGEVCEDSCVEFFFTPGTDTSAGYFNLETNCGGTMLFNHQLIPWKNPVEINDSDMKNIEIFHSEPKIVNPEKSQPTTWIVEYRLPIEILAKYCKVDTPEPGAIWKANFYKCADSTSQPHWLAWSPVDIPSPTFHMPEFFGTLLFK